MTIQPSLSLTGISTSSSFPASQILTGLFKNLREVKTEIDLLQTAVEIIYQTLKCDRVVVYSLQSDSYCTITAEAVTPGYTQTLGMTIQDSCFEKGYIEKYSRGRVRAINDIHQSTINPCHIENLEKIDVKSNLVTPIVNRDNSLYGLLVMHQCDSPRQWQRSEVEFVLQVSSWLIEQIAHRQTFTRLESQKEDFKQIRQSIDGAIGQIYQAVNAQEALQQGVEHARKIINCDRVVVYGLQDESMGEIVAESAASALASILGDVIKDPCFEYRYIDKYQQGRIRSTPNIFEAGMTDCYVENLAKIGVKSNLVAPINLDDGNIYGLLVAHHCFDFKDWQPEEIEHFKEIAFHTGLSLSKARIRDRSQTIETGLHQLSHVKDTVNLAKHKMEQIEPPMRDTGKILIEVNNLNKLLEREIDRINQDSSMQTKKDTKLIQIIARKLIAMTPKLRTSLGVVNNNSNQAQLYLNEAIEQIEGNESNSVDL